jgi:voltage-gated potassium channel
VPDSIHSCKQTSLFLFPVILTALVIVLGGIAEYPAEHKLPGANITTLSDALWRSVITITTVGYGDYTPVSPIGKIIGVIVMSQELVSP